MPFLTSETGLRREWPLVIVLATALWFATIGSAMLDGEDGGPIMGLAFVVLFTVILVAAFAVVRHAKALAEMLGDPLGTLILTLSITIIEVLMISAVMFSGSSQPTLARDTLFSVLMIVLNGLLGLSLLLGGWRFREQRFNLSGANAFLAVITPLAMLGLILPSLTSSEDASLSPLQAVAFSVIFPLMYAVFLLIQTVQHREQFQEPKRRHSRDHTVASGSSTVTVTERVVKPPATRALKLKHTVLLIAYLAPVVLLSEQIAVPIEHGIEALGAPVALGGLIVAVLILTPEAISGLRAALENRLQRAVNYYLGAVTATISLTIPATLVIGLLTGREVLLGLEPVSILLLVITLLVTILTFESKRTNVLHGAVHLALFATYVILIFD